MHQRTLRRSTALAAAALFLSAPLLSACSEDPATDRINTISSGVNNRDGNIDVLGAVIVSDAPNSGAFEATLANNSADDAATDTLQSLTGGDAHAVKTAGTLKPVQVPGRKAVSMIADRLGIPVTGSFTAGDFVTITLGFQSGQMTTMTIPVVRPCYQYAGIVGSGGTPTGTGTPDAVLDGETNMPTETDSPSTFPEPSSTTIDPDGGNNDPYSCVPVVRPTDSNSAAPTEFDSPTP